MPFKSAAYHGIFTPQELNSLQKAYNLCCEILGRLPASQEDKEDLARYVMRAFDYSDGDVKLSAERAANMARMLE